MQFVQFDAEPESLRRKRAIPVASVFLAMAAVIFIAFLFIHGNPSNNQEMSLQSQNSTLKLSLYPLDLHSITTRVSSLKLKNIGLTQKKLASILAIISSYDQNIQNRTVVLTLTYFFDIIDTDNDQLISQKEWSTFITALFPQDTGKYIPLFKEFNEGKSFNFQQFCGLIGKKLQEDIKPLTPVTQSQVTLRSFEKLIIFDSRNYELTYTLIFKIFDQDDNKVLTKAELTATLTAFQMKDTQASEKTNQVFSFAQQYKISADGQSIKFADFKQFALGYQKVLQEQYKTASTMIQIENLQSQLLLTKIEDNSRMIISKVYSNVLAETQNARQEAIKQHLFQAITEYEFQLFNKNGDTVVSRTEYTNVIDAIYKNEDDRKHFYSEFDGINGGKDVTLKQFQAAILKKISSPDQIEHYIPKENPKEIGRRAFSFIVNNDRNYTLSSEFIFNLFDLNADKVVELAEVQNIIAAFTDNAEEISRLNEGAANAFKALSNQGVGDGSKITQVEWVTFTKKIRHQLIEVFADPAEKSPRGRPGISPEDQPIMMLSLLF